MKRIKHLIYQSLEVKISHVYHETNWCAIYYWKHGMR